MSSITLATFRLAAPFWLASQRRKMEWLLGLAVVALTTVYTGLNLWLNNINKAFYDALQALDAPGFNQSVMQFFIVVGILVVVVTVMRYLEQVIEIRWRRHMTDAMVRRWLDGHTFYRIERDNLCDNPDQRISQDIAEYVKLMISLTLGFIVNLGTLITMGWVLWQSAGPMTFDMGSSTLTIPGYLFWLLGRVANYRYPSCRAPPGGLHGGAAVSGSGLPFFPRQGTGILRADRTISRAVCRIPTTGLAFRSDPAQLVLSDAAQHVPQCNHYELFRDRRVGATRSGVTQGTVR